MFGYQNTLNCFETQILDKDRYKELFMIFWEFFLYYLVQGIENML